MFLRRFERGSRGRRRTYWALVESERTGRGSRQRVVAYLGELKRSEQSGWAELGRKLSGKQRPQRSLFDPPHYDEPSDDEPVLVRLRDVRLERLRDFGDVWMALGLWRLLGLDTLLESLAPAGREEVPWPVVAAILTIARFCRPQSELHIESTWYRGTALEDLLGVPVDKVHTDRLYVGLDWLLPLKPLVEKHRKERLGALFDLEYELLLYDVTSTYFEGQCRANTLARRGYSRDSRPDCLQVCIGLVVTADGIPLGYEVFAGNRNDATTVEEIVAAMEKKYGRAQRIWVMDRGMVSEKNLAFLRARGGQYLVGTPKAMLRQFERHLTEKGWHEVQEGVEVKLVPGPEGDETFLLARSADRREKEKAMHERFEKRIEEGLQRIEASCRKQRMQPLLVAQRLGRLLGQNSRAAGLFQTEVQTTADGRALLVWKKVENWRDWAALSEGCYLLRSNVTDWTDEELWKAYIQLTEAEGAFRIHKSDLGLRPIWHQKEERVQAHILVCFLAYVLWKTLGQKCRRAGLGDEPRRVIEELSEIELVDVVLPTRQGAEIRRRCITEPTDHQAILLAHLGMQMPKIPLTKGV